MDLVGSNWIKLDQAIDKNGLYMFLTLDIHSLEPSGLKKHGLGKHEPDTCTCLDKYNCGQIGLEKHGLSFVLKLPTCSLELIFNLV